MTRYSDWASRLEAFLLAQAGRKFQYGCFDCCLFVCDAVQAMTGTDPAHGLRRYNSAKTAAAMIRSYGQSSVGGFVASVAARLGMREIAMPYAKRGDVVLLKRGARGSSLGLLALDGAHAIVPGAVGLVGVPRLTAMRAWAV